MTAQKKADNLLAALEHSQSIENNLREQECSEGILLLLLCPRKHLDTGSRRAVQERQESLLTIGADGWGRPFSRWPEFAVPRPRTPGILCAVHVISGFACGGKHRWGQGTPGTHESGDGKTRTRA